MGGGSFLVFCRHSSIGRKTGENQSVDLRMTDGAMALNAFKTSESKILVE